MQIQHNIMAMNAYRNYASNTNALSKNLEKLSSGYKINRAGDDAAGLAISEKMRAQITGLQTAQDNAKSGINLVQTAEGSLTEVHDMLNRMVELSDQSANGTYDDSTDRGNLQKEVTQLQSEIDRIADSSNFNGIKLLNGKLGNYNAASITGQTSFQDDPATVTGGNLADTDAIGFNVDTDGAVTLTSIAGVASADFATNGITVVADASNPATNTTGTSKFSLTIDTAVANADLADKLKGLQISFTTTALPSSAETATFTVQADANGNVGGGLTLQIGDTSDSFNQLTVNIQDMHTSSLGISSSDIDISTQAGASAAVDKIKTAINTVSSVRGTLGATQNRLDHTINNLSTMTENIQDAESNIRDTDVAEEMMAYTKNNILVQSAQAMLAQANQVPQGVLQLLQ